MTFVFKTPKMGSGKIKCLIYYPSHFHLKYKKCMYLIFLIYFTVYLML